MIIPNSRGHGRLANGLRSRPPHRSCSVSSTLAGIVASGILGGSGVAFVNALSFAAVRSERHTERIITTLLYACIGMFLLRSALVLNGTLLDYPRVLIMQFVWLYAFGPLYYWNVRAQVHPDFRLRPRDALHLLPVGLVLVLDVYFYVHPEVDETYLRTCLVSRFEFGPASYMWLAGVAGLGAYGLAATYSLLGLWEIAGVWRNDAMPAEVRYVCIFLGGAFIAVPLLFLGDLLVSEVLGATGLTAVVLMLVSHDVAVRRNPDLLPCFCKLTRRKSYEKSVLSGLDTETVLGRLRGLMEDERLYADEDLSLGSLAEELSLNRHQLSELLNRRTGMNFNAYVNQYRIRAACEMLTTEPDRSVLSVAHAAGFNSKSAFHSAFAKFTGQTPQQYRRSRS